MVRIFSLLAETLPLPLAAQTACRVSTPVSLNVSSKVVPTTYTVTRTENKGEEGMKRRNYESMSRAKSQEKYSLPIGPLRPIPTLLTCPAYPLYI